MKLFKAFRLMLCFIAIAHLSVVPVLAEIVEGPKVRWMFSMWGKKRGMTAGIEFVADEVARRTNGKFQIKRYYGEALSKARENLDGLRLGAYQVAFFCNFYHPGKMPAWMIFTLPFLPLGDLETSQRVREKMWQHPTLLADMRRWRSIPYISGVLPPYEFMGTGKPPKNLEDWKGLRVRAGGGIGLAMAKLGATRMTLPSPEIYTSVDRGTLDAASMPYSYGFESFKIDTVTDWFTSNLSPGTTECGAAINKQAYEDLPPQYRDLLQEIKPAAYKAQLQAYRDLDKKNIPSFERRLEKITYTPEQLAQFRKIAGKPVWDQWVRNNQSKFDAQGLLDDLLKEIEAAKEMIPDARK